MNEKEKFKEIKFERTIYVPDDEYCNGCLFLRQKEELFTSGLKKLPYCVAFYRYLEKTEEKCKCGKSSTGDIYFCYEKYEKCLECKIRSELPSEAANEAVDLLNETLAKAVKSIIKHSFESDKK